MDRFYAPSPLLRSRSEGILWKERDTIDWIEGFTLEPLFWDGGANVGGFSMYALARKQATVVAFEPSVANTHVLSRSVRIYRMSDRVAAYCLALSDRTKLDVLNLVAPEPGGRNQPVR